jgi:GntR family transcriptional regulator
MKKNTASETVSQQILRICREQIATGVVKKNEQFPSERDLAHRYRISRATANKVLSSLVAEKLLYYQKGIGTFVSSSRGLHLSLIDLESFTDQATALGLVPSTEVIDFQDLDASDLPIGIAAHLHPKPGERFFFCERLRLADNTPVILERRWIRASFVPGLQGKDLGGSFYRLMFERYGMTLTGEDHVISAKSADKDSGRKLRIPKGKPLLVVEGPGFTVREQPLWHRILLCRADRYHLESIAKMKHDPSNIQFRFL